MNAYDKLYEVIRTLRGPQGCPWDREQTVETLTASIIEESFELVEAIENQSRDDLQEELGDLFFIILFLGYVSEQENRFTLDSVIEGAAEKLIRRHPHVFANPENKEVDQVLVNWEAIKKTEEKNKTRQTPFDGIPKGLPEVQRLFKIFEKMRRQKYPFTKPGHDELKQLFQVYLETGTHEAAENFYDQLFLFEFLNKKDLSALVRSLGTMQINTYLKWEKSVK